MAHYPCSPIYSVSALSKMLGEHPANLKRLALKSDVLYRSVPQIKKNGELRETFDAYESLKKVQKKIAALILNRVQYPDYLHGGIRDRKSPRSIYSNTKLHLGNSGVILMDVENFYPSITFDQVFFIFTKFFGFGGDVSLLLAKLLTKHGRVPQGACTSSHLSNLIFWDVEPKLHSWLTQHSFVYSRFADDITISSKESFDNSVASEVVSKVIGMLASKGCKLKRSKFHVRIRGHSLSQKDSQFPLTVTGLSVFNKDKPSITQSDRNKIRSAVKKIEVLAHSGCEWPQLQASYNKAMGQVGRLIACNHREGARLKNRLGVVKSYYDSDSLVITEFVTLSNTALALNSSSETQELPW